jgi:hypothetical protein
MAGGVGLRLQSGLAQRETHVSQEMAAELVAAAALVAGWVEDNKE